MEKEDLNAREQERVIRDIINWKQESPGTLSREEFEEFRRSLNNMSTEDLIMMWESNVGEYILSRNDVHSSYNEEDGDEIVNNEFELLLDSDSTTNYGYL